MARSTDVPISKPSENESLLIQIVMKDDTQRGREPPIQMVPHALREVRTNETCFDPKVVSLGPYHCKKDCPKPMDCLKEDAVRWFVSLLPVPNSSDKVNKIYKDFVIETSRDSPLRDWYAADGIKKLKDEDITFMMFLDGCFILHFVYQFEGPGDHSVRYPPVYKHFIVSDMFLLENQIPYVVLKSLMSLMPDPKPLTKEHIKKFIQRCCLPQRESQDTSPSPIRGTFDRIGSWAMPPCLRKRGDHNPSTSNSADEDPRHLLDLLRTMLIGGRLEPRGRCNGYYFRSIMELKAAGIKLCNSHSSNLNKIKFTKCLICGYLSLPQMIIDDATKTRLLNLIAYEMCPGFPPDFVCVITSYVCFLDSLIDHADDVKELRSEDILLNGLGSDEEVAKLFNEVAINLVPDPRIYASTLSGIQSHCRNQFKVWLAEFLHTHFRTPWSATSLLAAIFLLFLTAVQTWKTVWPKK